MNWTDPLRLQRLWLIFAVLVITPSESRICQPIPSYPAARMCDGYNKIPHDILNKHNLTYLEMGFGSNAIPTLVNGSLLKAGLPLLEKLSLEKCKIEVIELGAFTGGGKISELILSHNLIKSINPEVFSNLTNLRILWLQGNPIKHLSGTFPSLKLTHLYLHLCEIQSISPEVFTNLKALKNLDLWQNNLSKLDWNVFRGLSSLEMVPLGKNPWNCDCHVRFLIDYFLEKGIKWETSENEPECVGDLFTWKTWNELRNESMSCPPKITSLTISQRSIKTHFVFSRSKQAYIECNYSGYPQPEVKWFKYNRLLQPDKFDEEFKYKTNLFVFAENVTETERRFSTEFRQELIISDVEWSDEGVYKCEVSTPSGTDSKSVLLTASCLVSNILILVIIFTTSLIILLIIALAVIKACEKMQQRRESFIIPSEDDESSKGRSRRTSSRLTQRPSAPNASDESAQSFL